MPALEIMGMPLPFEEAEYARRVDAARRALADAGLDGILLFHQESQHYLFVRDIRMCRDGSDDDPACMTRDDELLVLEVGACARRYDAVGIHSKWLGGEELSDTPFALELA